MGCRQSIVHTSPEKGFRRSGDELHSHTHRHGKRSQRQVVIRLESNLVTHAHGHAHEGLSPKRRPPTPWSVLERERDRESEEEDEEREDERAALSPKKMRVFTFSEVDLYAHEEEPTHTHIHSHTHSHALTHVCDGEEYNNDLCSTTAIATAAASAPERVISFTAHTQHCFHGRSALQSPLPANKTFSFSAANNTNGVLVRVSSTLSEISLLSVEGAMMQKKRSKRERRGERERGKKASQDSLEFGLVLAEVGSQDCNDVFACPADVSVRTVAN